MYMQKFARRSSFWLFIIFVVHVQFLAAQEGNRSQRDTNRQKGAPGNTRSRAGAGSDTASRSGTWFYQRGDSSSRRGDSSSRNRDSSFRRGDSSYRRGDSSYRRGDSSRMRGGVMSSLFADSNTLTSSDYQLQIEKTFLSLQNIENNSHLGPAVANLTKGLRDGTSVLAVLKDNVVNNKTALNLKNLQVFKTLLGNIKDDLKDDRKFLDSNENKLLRLRSELRNLITDTILRQLTRNDSLRSEFGTQLRDLRRSFVQTTRQVRESLNTINLLQTQTSSNSISTNQLLEDISNLVASSAKRIFSKEYNYMWERDTTVLSEQARQSFTKVYEGERKAISYYFSDNGYKTILLLIIGLLFYLWVNRNMRYLKQHESDHKLEATDFEYLRISVLPSALIVIFAIAPIFDLHAPSAYIEAMQFMLLCVVTYMMYKRRKGKSFWIWVALAVLYLSFSLTSHTVEPVFFQRWWLVALNVAAIIAVKMFLSTVRQGHPLKRFLWLAGITHYILNLLSIICNLTGRYTLAQILGNTAIFGITQAVGLAMFSRIWLETILSQMVASRMRNGLTTTFEYKPVLRSFTRPIKFLIAILWLIVLTTNLNLYSAALSGLQTLLETPRSIGNASFTLGGIFLFFMIIWVAHLLQKYIGYFFGDTGSDEDAQNKVQRSRLLIARLVLLCIGYLLAVTASGIPVDKITIVLGALGVGIGLGLQNIVSNFVSGIILIFDRPLQIGDMVEIGDKIGKVREIGLRSSTLLTQDGAEVIIPNGDLLSRQIVNWTLTNNMRRLELDLVVKGSNDMELVSTAVKKGIAASNLVVEGREPQLLITKITDDGLELKAFCWCGDAANAENAKSAITVSLHNTLKAENLSLR
jgi:potassium-dependent mechanosensitive channel